MMKPSPRARGGRAIGDLLAGLLPSVAGSEALEQLEAHWREVAGERRAEASRVLGYRGGVLRVAVDGAALRSELEVFERARIEAQLRSRLPGFRTLRLVAG